VTCGHVALDQTDYPLHSGDSAQQQQCGSDCIAMDIQPRQELQQRQKPADSCRVEYVPMGEAEPELQVSFEQQLPTDSKLWGKLQTQATVVLQLIACSEGNSTCIKLDSVRAYLQDADSCGFSAAHSQSGAQDISTAALVACNALLQDVTVEFRAEPASCQQLSSGCKPQRVRSINPCLDPTAEDPGRRLVYKASSPADFYRYVPALLCLHADVTYQSNVVKASYCTTTCGMQLAWCRIWLIALEY
jgi:hypothetical protein